MLLHRKLLHKKRLQDLQGAALFRCNFTIQQCNQHLTSPGTNQSHVTLSGTRWMISTVSCYSLEQLVFNNGEDVEKKIDKKQQTVGGTGFHHCSAAGSKTKILS